jgi:flagellar biosynthesis anti-sigma factor FlgM
MRIDGQAAIQKLSGVRCKSVEAPEELERAGGDSMELSTRAADIRTALDALSSVPEVREDRVAVLTQELEKGTLTQDGRSLAEKLLSKRRFEPTGHQS